MQGNISYLRFIQATVNGLLAIRGNPTTAKIENLLIDLQALALDQESEDLGIEAAQMYFDDGDDMSELFP